MEESLTNTWSRKWFIPTIVLTIVIVAGILVGIAIGQKQDTANDNNAGNGDVGDVPTSNYIDLNKLENAEKTKLIDAEVAAINKSLGKYKTTKRDVDDISAEGAVATYYSDDKVIRKIHVEIFGESGRMTIDFYYKNKNFIFTDSKDLDYRMPVESKVEIIGTEYERLYFEKGKFFTGTMTRNLSPKDSFESYKSAESNTKLDSTLQKLFK